MTQKDIIKICERDLQNIAIPLFPRLFIFLINLIQVSAELEKPLIIPELSSNYVQEKERALLTCRVFDNGKNSPLNLNNLLSRDLNTPEILPQIEWKFINPKSNTLDKIRNKQIIDTKRLNTENNVFESVLWLGFDGGIGIKNNQFGDYICRARYADKYMGDNDQPNQNSNQNNTENMVSKNYVISNKYSLKKLKNKNLKPVWIEELSLSQAVRPLQSITIHCQAKKSSYDSTPNNQNLQVIWFYNHYPINFKDPEIRERFVQSQVTGALTIKTVEMSDDGYYTCMVKNQFASLVPDHDSRLYVIQLNTLPVWREEPPKQMVILPNEKVEISCAASGWPKPVIKWYNLTNKTKLQINEATLIQQSNLQNIRSGPIGYNTFTASNFTSDQLLSCLAINRNGQETKNTKIIVKQTPHLVKNLQPVRNQITEHSIQLTWDSSDLTSYYNIRYRKLVKCYNNNLKSTNINPECSYLDPTTKLSYKIHPIDPKKPNVSWSYDKNIISNKHTIRKLDPYSSYQIQIQAINEVGESKYASTNNNILITTLATAPENPPENLLAVFEKNNDTFTTVNNIHYRWQIPEITNGKISGFTLKVYGFDNMDENTDLEEYFKHYDWLKNNGNDELNKDLEKADNDTFQKPDFSKNYFIPGETVDSYSLKNVNSSYLYIAEVNYKNSEGTSKFSKPVAIVSSDHISSLKTDSNKFIKLKVQAFRNGINFSKLDNQNFRLLLKSQNNKQHWLKQEVNHVKSYLWNSDLITPNTTYKYSWQIRQKGKFWSPPNSMGIIRTPVEIKHTYFERNILTLPSNVVSVNSFSGILLENQEFCVLQRNLPQFTSSTQMFFPPTELLTYTIVEYSNGLTQTFPPNFPDKDIVVPLNLKADKLFIDSIKLTWKVKALEHHLPNFVLRYWNSTEEDIIYKLKHHKLFSNYIPEEHNSFNLDRNSHCQSDTTQKNTYICQCQVPNLTSNTFYYISLASQVSGLKSYYSKPILLKTKAKVFPAPIKPILKEVNPNPNLKEKSILLTQHNITQITFTRNLTFEKNLKPQAQQFILDYQLDNIYKKFYDKSDHQIPHFAKFRVYIDFDFIDEKSLGTGANQLYNQTIYLKTLIPGYQYNFNLFYQNSKGQLSDSTKFSFSLQGQKPVGAPKNLHVTSTDKISSISLLWNAVDFQLTNGEITDYQIYIISLNQESGGKSGNNQNLDFFQQNGGVMSLSNNINRTVLNFNPKVNHQHLAEIDNLKVPLLYEVMIRAKNLYGYGPWSNKIHGRTGVAASKVLNLRTAIVSDDTVKIAWDSPLLGNTGASFSTGSKTNQLISPVKIHILSYHICYHEKNYPEKIRKLGYVNSDTHSFIIDKLLRNKNHVIYVISKLNELEMIACNLLNIQDIGVKLEFSTISYPILSPKLVTGTVTTKLLNSTIPKHKVLLIQNYQTPKPKYIPENLSLVRFELMILVLKNNQNLLNLKNDYRSTNKISMTIDENYWKNNALLYPALHLNNKGIYADENIFLGDSHPNSDLFLVKNGIYRCFVRAIFKYKSSQKFNTLFMVNSKYSNIIYENHGDLDSNFWPNLDDVYRGIGKNRLQIGAQEQRIKSDLQENLIKLLK